MGYAEIERQVGVSTSAISKTVKAAGKASFIKVNPFPMWKKLVLPYWERYDAWMRIIAKSRLRQYFGKSGNEKSQPYLNEWYHFCIKMKWSTPQDVKNTFRHASFLGNSRVVFNVKGNDYRIVCAMDYPRQAMYIKFVGTHGEYNAINAKEIK